MTSVKVEFSRLGVLGLIVIAGIVLIYLGYKHSDNMVLLFLGIGLGLGLILLAAYLWHWYQGKRAEWYPLMR